MPRPGTLTGLALAAALATCGDEAPALPPASPPPPAPTQRPAALRAARPEGPPAVAAPDRSPLLREDDLGGWTPAPEDCEKAVALVRAADGGGLQEFLDALTSPDRVRMVRAGIRLADPRAARFSAELCDRAWLDLWEQRRVAEILADAAFDPEYVGVCVEPVTLDEVFEFGSAAELAAVLERLRDRPAPVPADLGMAGSLHKLLRADHVPAAIELTRHGDEAVRRLAFELLGQAMEHTDRHRDAIAAALPSGATEVRIPAGAREPAVGADALALWRNRADRAPPSPPDRAELERRLAGADERLAADAARYLTATARHPGPWASVHAEPWSVGLDRVLLDSAAPWADVARAALAVPGCRTRAVAESLAERLPEPRDEDDRAREVLAYLEAAAPDTLRASLRRWASGERPNEAALGFLLDLRDVESVPAILAWCERLRDGNWAHVPFHGLEGLRHPAVRAFLVSHVERAEGTFPPSVTSALEAIAVQDGFPEGVGPWPWPGRREDKAPIVRLVLERKPVEAFVATLQHAPDEVVTGEGRVRDPRVRAHVESIRDRRELGRWLAASAELARSDAGVRSELQAGICEGRYRFTDDAVAVLDALGVSDDLVLKVLGPNLESNCCLAPIVGEAIDEVFGWDPTDVPRDRWTPAGALHAWWTRHEGRFVFSRIAGRWVPETP